MARDATMKSAWLYLCVVCASLLLLGCSNQNDADKSEPATAVESQNLTSPVVITLSSPSPLSPIAPVLLGANGATVNSSANVVAGTVVAMGTSGFSAGVSADANDVWSRGTAHLATNVDIRGTLHAVSSSTSLGDRITGTDTTPAFDPPQTLSWTVTYPTGTANNVSVPQNQTQSLAPGLYGTVSVGSNGTLQLSTGTYYLTGFSVAAQARVSITSGPVIVYVSTTISLGGTFVSPTADAGSGTSPDLLIAYLGTTAFTVGDTSCTLISGSCGPFNGAIVAPFATLTIQNIKSTAHTGFFAAQNVVLASSAEVQYRAPLAVVAAASPGGSNCAALLAAVVPPAQLADDIVKYCGCPSSSEDTDHDGTPDCIDQCPYDPLKIAPGITGCGIPSTDSDGDGVPDSVDQCPNDPNNTSPGQCGCANNPGAPVAPAGTPCSDTACPQSGATCDGNGVCGNRAACAPSTNCRLVTYHETSYWFCGIGAPPTGTAPDGGTSDAGAPPGQTTEANAVSSCGAKGLTLTRIDSLQENRFVAQFLTSPIWLGANDISASGTWRWTAPPNNNNGDIFWSGGLAGAPVNNRFAYWSQYAPSSQTCSTIRPGDGRWFDTSCSENLGYICEFRVPLLDNGATNPLPGGNGQPVDPGVACTPIQDAGLPDSISGIMALELAAEAGTFKGPPDGSTCPYDAAAQGTTYAPGSGAGCELVDLQPGSTCNVDSDCAGFGSGFVCRQNKNSQDCEPPDSGPNAPTVLTDAAGACKGNSVCGKLSCTNTPDQRCGFVQICTTGTDFDAGLDPTSNMDAEPFDPARLFDAAVDAQPSAGYSDPVFGSGQQHSWCFMKPQEGVSPASQPTKNKNGSSGGQSVITFGFQPDLIFDVNPNPLALGESGLSVHAQASLNASVSLHKFLGQNYTASIIDAVADLSAQRCSIADDQTTFSVFGIDFLDLDKDLGIPIFNTGNTPGGQACNNAVSNFLLYANRAKKAFRDAQQLLYQYSQAKKQGLNLSQTLCQDIGVFASNASFFPGGATCLPGETPEITINRFIDYFQAPGTGEIYQLKQAASDLFSKTLGQVLKEKLSVPFPGFNEEESQTVVNVPFAIGPIPMLLQIDVFAGYGIDGNFELTLGFPSFSTSTPTVQDHGNPNTQGPGNPLADLTATVAPFAYAGLSAFVGAGIDLGPLDAQLGIEGQLTLADVEAPIFAGAGVDMAVVPDQRQLPTDIAGITTGAFQFNAPKSFEFYAYYDYGAGIDLKNVLAGEIDAELQIQFFFFSETWRQRVVKFNGWSQHFDLVSGGGSLNASINTGTVAQPASSTNSNTTARVSTNVANGHAPMGISEPQVPLVTLTRLVEPTGPAPADGGVDAAPAIGFDAGNLESFFYDGLCCAKVNDPCNFAGTPQCCPDEFCKLTPGGDGGGFCNPQCRANGAICTTGSQCCSDDCGPIGTCIPNIPPP